MNARVQPLMEGAAIVHFLFASSIEANVRWLAGTLAATGVLDEAPLEPALLVQRITALRPTLVFVDFSASHIDAARCAVQAIRALSPQWQIVAVGTLAEPEGALAALRAGVRDFIDWRAGADEGLRVVRHVLENASEPVARHGRLTVLVGARAGVGVSTLAANLAVLLQKRGAGRQTALVDLGLPAGDAMLYLNARCEFDFVEAVRNLHRFDKTFVHTALARHTSGLALTTLPSELSALRTISPASAVALLERLRAFFDQQVVDLGGLTGGEFFTELGRAADEVWLVCDASIASVVSATDRIRELTGAQCDKGRMALVVNRFDPRLGLPAEEIAARLELPLLATLPSRHLALGRAANQGKLIVEESKREPYVRALSALAQRLTAVPGGRAPARSSGEIAGGEIGEAVSDASTALARIKRLIALPHKRH
jgi:pilus assembly protein CpaE